MLIIIIYLLSLTFQLTIYLRLPLITLATVSSLVVVCLHFVNSATNLALGRPTADDSTWGGCGSHFAVDGSRNSVLSKCNSNKVEVSIFVSICTQFNISDSACKTLKRVGNLYLQVPLIYS